MIEDRELAEQIAKEALKLRELNQSVGNTPIRQAIDECLTAVYVLATHGNLRKMNGGLGFTMSSITRGELK